VKVITEIVENVDLDLLRKTVDLIKQKIGASYVISLGSTLDKRALLVMATDKPDLDASRMIKAIAGEIGGSGGGRKDFAQAGGDNPGGFDKAFEKLKSIIREEPVKKQA
jgi:alanyl-tRNA synthetase